MIEKEINGQRYWCFEESEKEVRRNFEKVLVGEDAIKKMTLALVDAIAELQIQKQEAWDGITELLPEEYKPKNGETLDYLWLVKGFKLNPSSTVSRESPASAKQAGEGQRGDGGT